MNANNQSRNQITRVYAISAGEVHADTLQECLQKKGSKKASV